MLESDGTRRDALYGSESVRADVCVRRRNVHRIKPRHLRRDRTMPSGWGLQSRDWCLLELERTGRYELQRRQRVYDE